MSRNHLRQYNFLRRLRSRLLRLWYRTPDVHPTTFLPLGSIISRDIIIGPYGYVAPGAYISPGVQMGKYVMLAPNVTIIGQEHNYSSPEKPIIFSGRPKHPKTFIGDDVWIAANSTILCGCTIGDGAIVAATSLVTKDVEPYSVVAGSPAKKVRDRFDQREREIHIKMLNSPFFEGNYCGPIE